MGTYADTTYTTNYIGVLLYLLIGFLILYLIRYCLRKKYSKKEERKEECNVSECPFGEREQETKFRFITCKFTSFGCVCSYTIGFKEVTQNANWEQCPAYVLSLQNRIKEE